MSESQKLKLVFTNVYSKVRSLQVEDNFDVAVEREVRKTHIGMSDNYFFQQMCDLIFQSGVRRQVWARYESEIRKEFADYCVKKVSRYTEKDISLKRLEES